jgi:hypothetical protein
MAKINIDLTGITLPNGYKINFLLPMQVRDNRCFLRSTTPLLPVGSIYRTDSVFNGVYAKVASGTSFEFSSTLIPCSIRTDYTAPADSQVKVFSPTSSCNGLAVQTISSGEFGLFLLTLTLQVLEG